MTEALDWGTVMWAAARGDLPLVQFGSGPLSVALHARQPVYLATPYSKEVADQAGRWSRGQSFAAVLDAAAEVARLKLVGVSAFSPIVLSGMVVEGCALRGASFAAHDPLDGAAWLRWCQPFLNTCGAVVVPALEGWDRSEGIKAEVAFAVAAQVPVFVYASGVSDGN